MRPTHLTYDIAGGPKFLTTTPTPVHQVHKIMKLFGPPFFGMFSSKSEERSLPALDP